jgi:hypothetical protein
MSTTRASNPDLSTSEERWRRWEQRGRDNDARFMRRAQRAFFSALIVVGGVVILSFLY